MNTSKTGELLNKMIVLAANSHANQFDKQGEPYILHPISVMNHLENADEELRCIAMGHDLIEDCNITYIELKEMGFTDRIIGGIKCLTKNNGESYEEYKTKVKSNQDSIRVKIADLKQNTRIDRLKGTTQKDMERMANYFKFYVELVSIKFE